MSQAFRALALQNSAVVDEFVNPLLPRQQA